MTASQSGCVPARRPGTGRAGAGADVDRPQRKQTIALSEISVPQSGQITPCAPNARLYTCAHDPRAGCDSVTYRADGDAGTRGRHGRRVPVALGARVVAPLDGACPGALAHRRNPRGSPRPCPVWSVRRRLRRRCVHRAPRRRAPGRSALDGVRDCGRPDRRVPGDVSAVAHPDGRADRRRHRSGGRPGVGGVRTLGRPSGRRRVGRADVDSGGRPDGDGDRSRGGRGRGRRGQRRTAAARTDARRLVGSPHAAS